MHAIQTAAAPDAEFAAPPPITRPDTALLRYYLLLALFSGPGFPFVFIPLFCRYSTLTYRFDENGVFTSWGVLFRREISLTYRRIQDIHVTRNILQRWMGLATVSIQTASGSARPEMRIEGIREAEVLRDYLYRQMRGVRGLDEDRSGETSTAGNSSKSARDDEALVLLREIRDLLRQWADHRE